MDQRKNTTSYLPIIRSLTVLISLSFSLPTQAQSPSKDYLHYVQTFADTLLSVGLDHYGPSPTAMWASVIDTRNLSVPIRGVPPTNGVRPHDRAVGGSNYYHDVLTLTVFDQLSELTGNDRYRQAAHDYSQDFLERAQHPQTGCWVGASTCTTTFIPTRCRWPKTACWTYALTSGCRTN